VTRYHCVDDQKAAGFPVSAACDAAGVSTSGYYDWRTRQAAGPTDRQLAEAELVELMRDIFDASDGNYGVPRMRDELRRAGLRINEKRVRRLMRLHGMAGRCRRRRCQTTFPGPDGYHIPDLVGRGFEPGAPDRAWCQDITYIPTGEGWLYLASVLDLGSRRLLGYSMADHMRTELVLDALGMAIAARGGQVAGIIGHADRGSQPGFKECSQHCLRERSVGACRGLRLASSSRVSCGAGRSVRRRRRQGRAGCAC
jgi:putative transposase